MDSASAAMPTTPTAAATPGDELMSGMHVARSRSELAVLAFAMSHKLFDVYKKGIATMTRGMRRKKNGRG